MEEGRCAGVYEVGGFEPIAAFEKVGFARIRASHQGERGGTSRPLLPERFHFVVGLLELRDGGPPIAENRSSLSRRAPLTRNGQGIADAFGQRIGNRRRGVRR